MKFDDQSVADVKKDLLRREQKSYWRAMIRSKHLQRIAAGVFVILLIYLSIHLVGMYWFGWQDSRTISIGTLLRAPAIIVGDKWILVEQYFQEKRALEGFNKQLPQDQQISKNNIHKILTEELIRKELIRQIAIQYDVEITDNEIISRARSIFGQLFDDTERLNSLLYTTYGYSFAQYKQFVIRPLLLEEKLNQKLIQNNQPQAESLDDLIFQLRNTQKIYVLIQQ